MKYISILIIYVSLFNLTSCNNDASLSMLTYNAVTILHSRDNIPSKNLIITNQINKRTGILYLYDKKEIIKLDTISVCTFDEQGNLLSAKISKDGTPTSTFKYQYKGSLITDEKLYKDDALYKDSLYSYTKYSYYNGRLTDSLFSNDPLYIIDNSNFYATNVYFRDELQRDTLILNFTTSYKSQLTEKTTISYNDVGMKESRKDNYENGYLYITKRQGNNKLNMVYDYYIDYRNSGIESPVEDHFLYKRIAISYDEQAKRTKYKYLNFTSNSKVHVKEKDASSYVFETIYGSNNLATKDIYFDSKKPIIEVQYTYE